MGTSALIVRVKNKINFMQYRQAKNIALRILKQLQPFCIHAEIAGSIRREKGDIGDIELVCVPRFTEIKDLFQTVTGKQRSKNFSNIVRFQGEILKGSPEEGRQVKVQLPEGIVLDLFMPIETDWVRQFSIRTGSAAYSHKVLATTWLKNGWCGTHDGLRLQTECYQSAVSSKPLWICNAKGPTLPPVWGNEYDFFKWMGLTWIEPKYRNV